MFQVPFAELSNSLFAKLFNNNLPQMWLGFAAFFSFYAFLYVNIISLIGFCRWSWTNIKSAVWRRHRAGDNGGVKIAGGGVRGGPAERKQTRLRARQPASSHPDQPVGQLVEPVKTATK